MFFFTRLGADMGWRHNTDTPESGVESCLIAYGDDELACCYALTGSLYLRRGRKFFSEEDNSPPRRDVFWWLPEREVLQGLPASPSPTLPREAGEGANVRGD